MKRFLTILAALVSLSTQSQVSRVVTFAWDYEPSELTPDISFRLYELNGANRTLIGTVTNALTIQVDISPGKKPYVATAYSTMWQAESADSNIVITPPGAKTPTNLRI